MKIVTCPLKTNVTSNKYIVSEVCDKEGCAWYDEENKQCAIVTIARKELK